MYSSSHGIPRAASFHGTTSAALPGGLKDSDTLASQSCGLDSKNFLPTRLSQKSFNLNESLDIPPDELGMGVWYSKSPDHTSKSGNWNPDASKFSVGLDIGDVGDFYGDIMLDERLQSSDSIISGNRDRSGSEVLLGTNIAKSGGPLQLFNMDTLPTNITSQLSNEMKESRKSPSRSPPRSPKSPTVCPKTGSPSLFLTGVTSSESNEYLSEYLPPTWDPQSDFCFPVAELPVARFVPDNAELCHFQDITHIADGSNANIFLALFDNEKVIIKMIREEVQTDPVAVHEFDVEHGILVRVSHPHIIKIIAAGRIPRRFVVLEFLGSGSLNSILSANIKKTTFVGKYCHRPTFGFFNLINKARDLASALDYLHKRANKGTTIIHRDLKPDNVGFTLDGKLKLFDFGLCTCVRQRDKSCYGYAMTGNTGSLRYMAPEVALRQIYSEKVDVYSFGIMLWQMATDTVPFKGLSRDDFMTKVVRGGERPPLPYLWPTLFKSLLRSCWSTDSKLRPSFESILMTLQKMLKEL